MKEAKEQERTPVGDPSLLKIQPGDGGGRDHRGSRGGKEKWLDSRHKLQMD